MSEETKKTEEITKDSAEKETVITKAKGIATWIKNVIAAIVGAAISFGVTFGVISAEQQKSLNERMGNINTKAEEVVASLQKGDVNAAIATAKEIATITKAAAETVKEAVKDTKEKVEGKAAEVKQVAKDAKEAVATAVKKETINTNKVETKTTEKK